MEENCNHLGEKKTTIIWMIEGENISLHPEFQQFTDVNVDRLLIDYLVSPLYRLVIVGAIYK